MNSAAASLPVVGTRSRIATRTWLMTLLVGAAVLAVGAALVDGLPVGVTNDDGMYVILAKSLATGHGYRWLNLPGMPAATHFPPGYPVMLALLWLLAPTFPANVILFKLANALFIAVAAGATFALARQRLAMSDAAAAALTFGATLGIPMLTLSTIVMSEALFLALLVPTLLVAERVCEGEVSFATSSCWPFWLAPRHSYGRTVSRSSPPWCSFSRSGGAVERPRSSPPSCWRCSRHGSCG